MLRLVRSEIDTLRFLRIEPILSRAMRVSRVSARLILEISEILHSIGLGQMLP